MKESASELIANVDYADEIRKLHGELSGLAMSSVEKAIRIGELLTEQKAALKHGQWLPWLEQNVGFSRQTADNYQRVYRQHAKLPNIGNLTDAYKLLSRVAKEEEEGEACGETEDIEIATDEEDCQKHDVELKRANMKIAKEAIAIIKTIKPGSSGSYEAFGEISKFVVKHQNKH